MYIQCKSFTYRKFIFFKTLALIFSHNYVNIKHQVFLFYYVCLRVPVLFVNAYFVVFANSFLWLIPAHLVVKYFFLSFTPWFVVLTCLFWCVFCCLHLCVLLWFIPVHFVDVHFVVGASRAVEKLDCAHLLQWLHCPKELLKGPAQACVTLQQACHDGGHNGLQESNTK